MPAKVQVAANLAMIYAARLDLEAPRSLEGDDVSSWFEHMVDHAEANPNVPFATEFLNALEAIDETPEAS